MRARLAHTIEVDHVARQVRIDGLWFPYRLGREVHVRDLGIHCSVSLEVRAAEVRIITRSGTETVRQATLDEDLAWAAERGREIVRDGLANVLAWLDRARIANDRTYGDQARARAAAALAEHYVVGGTLLAECWCGWSEQPDCDDTGDTIERHLVDQVVAALQQPDEAPKPEPD